MSLFTQEIKLEFKDQNNIIERVDFDKFDKGTLKFVVAPGTVAYIDGVKYRSGEIDQKFKKKEQDYIKTIYLTSSSLDVEVPISRFFGGQYELAISLKPTIRGIYSLVGTATVKVDDYPSIIKKFQKTISKNEFKTIVEAELKNHITAEIKALTSNHMNSETTDEDLQKLIPTIIDEFKYNTSNSSLRLVQELGVIITKISLHINAIGDTEKTIQQIKEELLKVGLNEIEKPIRDEKALEDEKQREFEIKLIKAQNTTISETKQDITKTINGENKEIKKEEKKEERKTPKYCSNCGYEIKNKNAKFCENCGNKL